ncbi:MAG: NAD-dependent epimerase/dehydratase family protein [Armatimonadetes bacterium]|nr:NAD-dependent epimerase/dehydratase family protein [Armatimonadota bacterium]
MKVLVTGGAGFIASNIVDAYLERGDEVVVVDNLRSGRRSNVNPKAKLYEVDLCDSSLGGVFDAEKPEWVNHHAAQIDVRYSMEHPMEDARINILGSLNLMEQCRKQKVRHVIFASTGGAIYGEPLYLPIDEAHPPRPLSAYAAAKLSVETYLRLYRSNYGLDYTVLRYANVYGPRQDPLGEAGVVSIFINRILRGERPTIYGTGEQTRDYIFVGDIVRMSLLCGENTAGETINLGTGVATSVNDLFAVLKDLMEFTEEAEYAPPRTGELEASVLNADYARERCGWSARVSLREGLQQTVDYFRQQQAG